MKTEISSEVRLWKMVILQNILDLKNNTKTTSKAVKQHIREIRKKACIFFTDKENLKKICELSDTSYYYIQYIVKKLFTKRFNNVDIFNDERVRKIIINNENYFSLRDVVLVIKKPKDVKDYIKKYRKKNLKHNTISNNFIIHPFKTKGGMQNIKFMDLRNLYFFCIKMLNN